MIKGVLLYKFKDDEKEYQEIIEIDENKTYIFTHAVNYAIGFLNKKYGWDTEKIVKFDIKLEGIKNE